MPNKPQDYHTYSHSTTHITDMGSFVSESDSLGIGFDIAKLLIYEDEFGRMNLDKLDDLYTTEEHNKYASLMDQIRGTKSKQDQVVESSNTSATKISIETNNNSDSDTSPSIRLFNSKTFTDIVFAKTKELATLRAAQGKELNFWLDGASKNQLNKITNLAAKTYFLLFLEEIALKTIYRPGITSSTRTVERLRELKKINKTAATVHGDFDYHVAGLALDINLFLQEGKEIQAVIANLPVQLGSEELGSSPKEWNDSGVVKIAADYNINWGGLFSTRDLIHFDLKRQFVVDRKRFLKSLGVIEEPVLVTPEEGVSLNSIYQDLPIHIGTQLALPISKIDRDVLSTETNQTFNSVDFESFLAKQLIDLMSSDKYKKEYHPISQAFKGTVQEIYPHISVWIWSRALSISSTISLSDKTEYEHKIINVTPYILSLNTSVAENGGNFNISLAPITADLRNHTQGSSIFNKAWEKAEGTQKAAPSSKRDYVNQGHSHYIEDNELKRSRMYFDKVLQNNDLVFIKFEKLELEDKRQDLDSLEFIDIKDLPNQVFDMIALVDDIQLDTQHTSADTNVSVTGRDLVKLLIEDGVYFYPSEFTADGIFSNTGATNTRLGRFGANGQYLNRFQAANKTVERSLKFIINNLGTIEIFPNSLFDPYQNSKFDLSRALSKENTVDKRSKAYQLTNEQVEETNKQSRANNSEISRILDEIDKVQKLLKITNKKPKDVFESIQELLRNKIEREEIVIKNSKIESWASIQNEVDIPFLSELPTDLDGSFYVSDIVWVNTNKNGIDDTSAVEVLNTLYKRVQTNYKEDLESSSLDNFKLLSKKQSFLKQKQYFTREVSFQAFIDEIDIYIKESKIDSRLKPLFIDDDLVLLKNTYSKHISGGRPVSLQILIKTFRDVELSDRQKQIFNDIYNLTITVDSQKAQPLNQSMQPLAGIWQIIKLVVDDSVKDRRLTDSSIGNENGSILNAFRKICQDPFCEFYTDTYGDQFYFIVRKKPFDKESIMSMIQGRAKYEVPVLETDHDTETKFDKFGSAPSHAIQPIKQSLIIDIEEKDVYSDSLKYSTEAYSWYRLQLNNLTTGSASDMAFAYLKAIYFNEFADIYGSKPLDLSTSYIPYSPIIDKNKEYPTAYFIRQGVYDLKYMIESHAYLPFTRTGTIVIDGDRRIKRGNFVRLKGTGEIFYVDAVSNSFSIDDKSIDRTTTLQVSRGMVERFIDEKDNAAGVSYFNICDLPIDESIFSAQNQSYSSFSKASTSRWKVNKIAFNFFLKKLQFSKNDKELFNDTSQYIPDINNIA